MGFARPGITPVEWAAPDNFGLVGIESMTYTLDSSDPAPEPSPLLLSGIGLVALIGLAYRSRTKNQKAVI